MGWIILFVFILYVLLSLALMPMQYSYIKQLKEMEKKRKSESITQGEMYENMRFEEQQLHFNAQGNPIFMLANVFASILYRMKHK